MNSSIALLMISLHGIIPAAQPESIDACGWFEAFPDGCVAFQATLDGDCFYCGSDFDAVPDSLLDGAIVRVRADVTLRNWCGSYYEFVIENPMITACEPEDLGCGVLFYDDEYCHSWRSFTHGELLIGSMQGYEVGDTVRATGVIDLCTPSICFLPRLVYNTFHPCEDSPPAVTPDTWGAVKAAFR